MKIAPFAFAAVAALSIATLSAQNPEVRVHLPRAVAAGDNWLAAGDYTIIPMSTSGVLRFQSENGHSVMVRAEKEFQSNVDRTEVIIDKSGAAPHITKIEVEGSGVEYVLPTPTNHLVR